MLAGSPRSANSTSARDGIEQRLTAELTGDTRDRLEFRRSGIAGDEVEDARHVAGDRRIGRENS